MTNKWSYISNLFPVIFLCVPEVAKNPQVKAMNTGQGPAAEGAAHRFIIPAPPANLNKKAISHMKSGTIGKLANPSFSWFWDLADVTMTPKTNIIYLWTHEYSK